MRPEMALKDGICDLLTAFELSRVDPFLFKKNKYL